MVIKISDLIPENDEYLTHIKACILSDAIQLTVKKDPDDGLPFHGFEEDPEE